jgi:hypothetical protein
MGELTTPPLNVSIYKPMMKLAGTIIPFHYYKFQTITFLKYNLNISHRRHIYYEHVKSIS